MIVATRCTVVLFTVCLSTLIQLLSNFHVVCAFSVKLAMLLADIFSRII